MKQYDFRLRFDSVDVSPDSLWESLSTVEGIENQNVQLRMPSKTHGAALADVVIAATITGTATLVAAVINATLSWYLNKKSQKNTTPSQEPIIIRIDGHRKSRIIHHIEGQAIDAHILDSISEECGEIVEIYIGRSQR